MEKAPRRRSKPQVKAKAPPKKKQASSSSSSSPLKRKPSPMKRPPRPKKPKTPPEMKQLSRLESLPDRALHNILNFLDDKSVDELRLVSSTLNLVIRRYPLFVQRHFTMSKFEALPELVLHKIFDELDDTSVRTLRAVSQHLKSLVHMYRPFNKMEVIIGSLHKLKELVSTKCIPWSSFVVQINPAAFDPESHTEEKWTENFQKFFESWGRTLKGFRCFEPLLVYSDVVRLLTASRNLEVLHLPAISGTFFGKFSTQLDECRLSHLHSLTIEGVGTQGTSALFSHILKAAPNLKLLRMALGLSPSHYHQLHSNVMFNLELSSKKRVRCDWKPLVDMLQLYIERRNVPQTNSDCPNLCIDFGANGKITITPDQMLELCEACQPAGVVLENVNSVSLPKIGGGDEATTTQALSCIKSVVITSSTKDTYFPRSVKKWTATLQLKSLCLETSDTRPGVKTFELPPDKISEMNLIEMSEYIIQRSLERVVRKALCPRVELTELTVPDLRGPMDSLIDFNHFPNLTHLYTGRFSLRPERFWEMCQHLPKLQVLRVEDITDEHLRKSSMEAPITTLKWLRKLIIGTSSLEDSSMQVLSEMPLEELRMPSCRTRQWKVTLKGLRTLIGGVLGAHLRELEILMPRDCRNLKKCEDLIYARGLQIKRLKLY